MLRILPPVAFSLPFVMLTGQCDNLEDFVTLSCILILTSTSFSCICLLIGALATSPRIANALGVLTMIFSLIFGGLLVNRAVAHLNSTWYESLYYFAPLSYSYEAMMVQVLRDANIDFNPQGFNTNIKTDGSIWLANFGLNADRFSMDFVALGCFTLGSLLLTLPALSISHGRVCRGTGRKKYCEARKDEREGEEEASKEGNSTSVRTVRLSSNNISHPLLDGAPSITFTSSTGQKNSGGEFKDSNQDHLDRSSTPQQRHEQHHVLTFMDVKCVLPSGRCILKNVRGEVDTATGGVYAIMGPSGAGKTSLLDIIAGRKNTGSFEGHVMVDGVEFTRCVIFLFVSSLFVRILYCCIVVLLYCCIVICILTLCTSKTLCPKIHVHIPIKQCQNAKGFLWVRHARGNTRP
jgi:ABC-type multidrug transport system fused ATPase/permease subunit